MERTLKTAPIELRWLSRTIILLLITVVISSSQVQAGDFLKQPAFKTRQPDRAALMDITRTGHRLVAVGERGLIIYSDDDGRKWTQATVPLRTTLTAICFSEPKNGWAVGHESVLLHSTDQGTTWKKVLDGYQINKMMVSAMKKVVAGLRQQLQAAAPADKSALQTRLEDAEVNLKGFVETEKEGPIQPLLAITFSTPQEGLLVGAFGIILRTHDGGKSWIPFLDRINNPMGYHFYGIARTKTRMFIFGEAGGAYRSDDDGNHWQAFEAPYQGSYFGTLGDPEGNLIAGFGLRGNLVISYDNGDHWQLRKLGQGGALTGGARLSSKRFVLVGMAGVIYLGSTENPDLKPVKTGFPACMAATEAADGTLVLVGLRGLKKINLALNQDKKEVN